MTKKRTLPRLEVIVIIIFSVLFFLWAMQKCGKDRELYIEEHTAIDEPEIIPDTSKQTTANIPANDNTSTGVDSRPANQAPTRQIKEKYTPLYVTIENLNMRDAVGLNGTVLDRLKLYDEVVFLNEITDSIYEINLGGLVTNAPWIKVKSRKGKVGWVYGAGVHYYKKKLEGVK